MYIWSVRKGLVHTPECDWVDEILPQNYRTGDLADVETALQKGEVRRTCHICGGDEVEGLFPPSDRFTLLTPEQLEASKELEVMIERERARAAKQTPDILDIIGL